MGTLKVFLDANILFSASLSGAAFELLWQLSESGKVELCSSPYCLLEARTNLERKVSQALSRFQVRMQQVKVVSDAPEHLSWAGSLLPEKDAPVLAAARGARVRVLLTGDRRHFGPLMERKDLPLRVMTLRDFLQEGPRLLLENRG